MALRNGVAWARNARAGPIVCPVERTAGRSAFASARTSGSAASTSLSAGRATDSVRGSCEIAVASASLRAAKAAIVVLKSRTSDCRASGRRSSAEATAPACAM